jgi:RND family efflux transporter MFP subunit
MWFWRVILPGAGLAASVAALGLTLRGGHPDGRADRVPLSITPGATARDGNPPRPSGAGAGEAVVVAEGRVVPGPGAEVTLGTALGGVVAELPAREKLPVRRGDLLVRLRADDREAALAEAEARLAEADAELAYQRREFQRRLKAPAVGLGYASELDAAHRGRDVAEAPRKAAQAVVAQCRSALAQTRITATIDGVVTACFVQAGETVPPAARLVTVTDLANTRVEAEVDEFDAPRVAPGAEVTVTAEGFGPAPWRGTVEEIPDRVAERTGRPEDPGRPTDTRVLLVKIALPKPHPLKLGQQVEVAIRPPPEPEPGR